MTVERASELVRRVVNSQNGVEREELFSFFVDYFNMSNETVDMFAELCGYGIVNKAEF